MKFGLPYSLELGLEVLIVILTSASVVIFNALADITYAIIDPRIRLE
ncbi:MAG TPA: hypothetical protein VKR83_08155 [Ktedonobacteraceae bacterium]|nr:hypothetical protein [Ktedonobacteraceae bacterium]